MTWAPAFARRGALEVAIPEFKVTLDVQADLNEVMRVLFYGRLDLTPAELKRTAQMYLARRASVAGNDEIGIRHNPEAAQGADGA